MPTTTKRKGIGSHQSASSTTDTWLTPPWVIKALGEFDLDPCFIEKRPWDTAKKHYTIKDNGLIQPWEGRVWLNPPYSDLDPWLEMISKHMNGILLLFARIERVNFHDYIWPVADSMFVPKGRFTFHYPTGEKAGANGGAPSIFYAYGEQNSDALADSGLQGKHIPLNSVPVMVITVSPSWKNVVDIALTRLQGTGDIKAIYEMVEQIAPDKIKKNKNYKEKIRQKLQIHFVKLKTGHYSNVTGNTD